MQALKIVAAGSIDEQDEGLSALRCVIEHARVGGDSELEEGFVEPELIFQRDEAAALVGGDRGGLRIERVETEIGVVGAVVEEAGVNDVPRCEVVLQANEIVVGPLFRSVGTRGLLFHHVESVLNADGLDRKSTRLNS